MTNNNTYSIGEVIFIKSTSLLKEVDYVTTIKNIDDEYIYFSRNKSNNNQLEYPFFMDKGLIKLPIKEADKFIIRKNDLSKSEFMKLFFSIDGWQDYMLPNDLTIINHIVDEIYY